MNVGHPGDADARPCWQSRGLALHHLTDDLMTGDDPRTDWRQITFHNMKIGSANATRDDFQQDLSGLQLRPRETFDNCRENSNWNLKWLSSWQVLRSQT